MNQLNFEWDPEKARSNLRKHGVSFEEAATVFDDPNHWRDYDQAHSDQEDRWLLIGLSERLRLISVVYTKRNETIRLISARRASKTETRRYVESH